MARPSLRFGIGEWYEKSFTSMSPAARQRNAEMQFSSRSPVPNCPFVSDEGIKTRCWKKGGVCSLRLYEKTSEGEVRPDLRGGTLRITCPSRFEQNASIYAWVVEVLLGSAKSDPIGQR
jgi:hypothetical protein